MTSVIFALFILAVFILSSLIVESLRNEDYWDTVLFIGAMITLLAVVLHGNYLC